MALRIEVTPPVLLHLPQPYLLFLGDITEPGYGKTAIGLRDWAPERCVGEYVLPGCRIGTGLERMTPVEAQARGARALVIAVATPGGYIPDDWIPALRGALESGLDIISGMHARLKDIPELRETAQRLGRTLFDVREPPADIQVATGRRRSGKRLLTVGTDCALGKKYTALALHKGFVARGVDTTFRATGQTGIILAGSGIAIDAVVSDFAAGAAEMLTPDNKPKHWDIIEGQGSLFHPAYAGVSLALLHGSQPDAFVLCHAYSRTHVLGLPDFKLPHVDEVIDQVLKLGRRTNPAIRFAGVSLNTQYLDDERCEEVMAKMSDRMECPVADPMLGGWRFDALVDACLE